MKTLSARNFGLRLCKKEFGCPSLAMLYSHCLLCIHYGCEPEVGAELAKTTSAKYDTSLFRSNSYTEHLKRPPPAW